MDVFTAPDAQKVLTTIQNDLATGISLLNDVVNIDQSWETLKASIDTINETTLSISAFTDAIPGLDVVVSALQEGCDAFNTAATSPIDPAFDAIMPDVNAVLPELNDVYNGLLDFQTLVQTLNADLPYLANTIKVFNALSEIVTDIAPMFNPDPSGTSVISQLQTLIGTYEDVANNVNLAVTPVVNGIQDIVNIKEELASLASDMAKIDGSAVQEIKKGLADVESVFGKVSGTVNTMLSDLGPVRHILAGVSSLVSKLLSPIISKVMHMTGLSVIQNELGNAIANELFGSQIQSLSSSVTSGMGPNPTAFASTTQASLGKTAVNKISNKWDAAQSILAQFKGSSQDNTIQVAINDFLKVLGLASLKAMIRFEPINIKDPVFKLPTVVEPQPAPLTLAAAPASNAPAPDAPAAFTYATNVNSLSQAVLADTDVTNTALSDLGASSTTLVQSLATSSQGCEAAYAALRSVSAKRAVPGSSNTQIGLVSNIVNQVTSILGELCDWYPAQLSVVQPNLAPLQNLSQRLQTVAQAEVTAQTSLQGLSSVISTAQKQVETIKALPRQACNVSGISMSTATTAQMTAMMSEMNTTLTGAGAGYSCQMETALAPVYSGAAQQKQQMDQASQSIASMASEVAKLQTASDSIATVFDQIASYGVPFQQSMIPKLTEVSKIATAAHSILSPLRLIITLAENPDANDAMMGDTSMREAVMNDAKAAMAGLEQFALSELETWFGTLGQKLEDLAIDKLNLDQLDQIFGTASSTLAQNVADLTSASAAIGNNLTTVFATIKPQKSYTWPAPTSNGQTTTITFDNAFVTLSQSQTLTNLTLVMMRALNNNGFPDPLPSNIINNWS